MKIWSNIPRVWERNDVSPFFPSELVKRIKRKWIRAECLNIKVPSNLTSFATLHAFPRNGEKWRGGIERNIWLNNSDFERGGEERRRTLIRTHNSFANASSCFFFVFAIFEFNEFRKRAPPTHFVVYQASNLNIRLFFQTLYAINLESERRDARFVVHFRYA